MREVLVYKIRKNDVMIDTTVMSKKRAFTLFNLYITISIVIAMVLLCLPPRLSALDVPELNARVNDYANMISRHTEAQLEAILRDLELSDSTQVVVLTIPSLEGEAVEDYSIRVAHTLGIGQKEYDNGVLFLVAKNERKIRIEVGYGLEGKLTDMITGRIIDYEISPQFKDGRFDEGFIRGVQAIVQVVQGEYKATRRPVAARRTKKGTTNLMPFFILLVVISFLGKSKRIFAALIGALLFPIIGWFTLSLGLSFILFLIPVGFILGLISPLFFFRGAYFGGRGFGSGGGFGGGSFGGFGGGGFGGGGASGGW
ncbi:MAG: TPM domain-containing protein [bacterium]